MLVGRYPLSKETCHQIEMGAKDALTGSEREGFEILVPAHNMGIDFAEL